MFFNNKGLIQNLIRRISDLELEVKQLNAKQQVGECLIRSKYSFVAALDEPYVKIPITRAIEDILIRLKMDYKYQPAPSNKFVLYSTEDPSKANDTDPNKTEAKTTKQTRRK